MRFDEQMIGQEAIFERNEHRCQNLFIILHQLLLNHLVTFITHYYFLCFQGTHKHISECSVIYFTINLYRNLDFLMSFEGGGIPYILPVNIYCYIKHVISEHCESWRPIKTVSQLYHVTKLL